MKIAYLTQPYPPMISGASIVVQQLAQGLAAQGHEVLVLAASDLGEGYTQISGNLRVVRLKSKGNVLRAGQRCLPRPTRTMLAELTAFRPDIIHLHDPFVMAAVGLRAARKLGVPVTFTTHQLPWFVSSYLPNFPELRKMVEKALWWYCGRLEEQTQAFISPTATIARAIDTHAHFHPVVISNGMDLNRFQPEATHPDERANLCRQLGLDPKRPIILHVGRLDIEKNVQMVVRAAAKAMQNFEAQLVVAGDGKQRNALIKLAANYGLGERTHFTGFVDPAGVLPALYRQASLFITASEIETQGLVLLEAMASELPVVAVRATCIPEIIHDGINGYLVPPEGVELMAERIVDILANPEAARQMGQAGRKIASQHSRTVTIRRHEKLYQKLAAEYTTSTPWQRLRKRLTNKYPQTDTG